MGCWNGTCGLTGLHINAGDEVVAFLIGMFPWTFGRTEAENGGARSLASNVSGFYYPTDYAFPISLPFFGKYNDYGGVEGISKGQFWLERTRDFIAPGQKPPGIEDFINDEVERDRVCFTFDESNCEPFRLEHTEHKKLGVGLFMVLKEAVDEAYKVRRAITVSPQAARYRWYRFPTLRDYIQGGQERYEKVKRGLDTKAPLHWMMWGEHHEEDYSKDEPKINLVGQVLGHEGLGGNLWGSEFLGKHVDTATNIIEAEGPGDPRLKELSELCFWYNVVSGALASTRGSWLPKGGKGSQASDFSFYLAFTRVVRRRAREQQREVKEWGMED